MRAVQLTAYGDPLEGLKYVDIPEPEAPRQNQVLIGVEFSPLNQRLRQPTNRRRLRPSENWLWPGRG